MTDEIRIDFKVSNPIIAAKCIEHGGVMKFSKLFQVNYGALARYLRYELSPWKMKGDDRWSLKESAKRLRIACGVTEQELFSPLLYPPPGQFRPRLDGTVMLNATSLLSLSDVPKKARSLDDPNEYVYGVELRAAIDQTLATLRPRIANVIRMRFGLNGDEDALTMDEIAERMSISKERVRQLQAVGLRHLRHPAFNKRMKPFLEEL